jgi:hypothetical protein
MPEECVWDVEWNERVDTMHALIPLLKYPTEAQFLMYLFGYMPDEDADDEGRGLAYSRAWDDLRKSTTGWLWTQYWVAVCPWKMVHFHDVDVEVLTMATHCIQCMNATTLPYQRHRALGNLTDLLHCWGTWECLRGYTDDSTERGSRPVSLLVRAWVKRKVALRAAREFPHVWIDTKRLDAGENGYYVVHPATIDWRDPEDIPRQCPEVLRALWGAWTDAYTCRDDVSKDLQRATSYDVLHHMLIHIMYATDDSALIRQVWEWCVRQIRREYHVDDLRTLQRVIILIVSDMCVDSRNMMPSCRDALLVHMHFILADIPCTKDLVELICINVRESSVESTVQVIGPYMTDTLREMEADALACVARRDMRPEHDGVDDLGYDRRMDNVKHWLRKHLSLLIHWCPEAQEAVRTHRLQWDDTLWARSCRDGLCIVWNCYCMWPAWLRHAVRSVITFQHGVLRYPVETANNEWTVEDVGCWWACVACLGDSVDLPVRQVERKIISMMRTSTECARTLSDPLDATQEWLDAWETFVQLEECGSASGWGMLWRKHGHELMVRSLYMRSNVDVQVFRQALHDYDEVDTESSSEHSSV